MNFQQDPAHQHEPVLYAGLTRLEAPNAWVEVDRTRFLANVAATKKYIGPQVHIAAMLKSNAYGHGLEPMSRLCQECEQITYLTVFLLSDAVKLRTNGITKPILVLGGYDVPLDQAIIHGITTTVYNQEILDAVIAKSLEYKKKTLIHLKLDTGMTRLGFVPDDVGRVVDATRASPFIEITGMLSHFSQSDAADSQYTQLQADRFATAVTQLKSRNCIVPYLHIANTAATLRFGQVHWTMVRAGGLLYGSYDKRHFCRPGTHEPVDFGIRPIMTVKSRIIDIKEIQTGTPVGYSCSFVAQRPMRLAIVSMGYYDGFDRRMSNQGHMLVHGALCPIVGRVSMNMATIDISAVPPATFGDTVTVIGDYDGIRLADMAEKLGTIDYDIMTKINATLPRIVV